MGLLSRPTMSSAGMKESKKDRHRCGIGREMSYGVPKDGVEDTGVACQVECGSVRT